MAARVFFLFALGYFLSYFYRSANAVLAKDLSQELGLGPAELGFMTSLFYLAFAAAQLPLGGFWTGWGPGPSPRPSSSWPPWGAWSSAWRKASPFWPWAGP